MLKFDATPVWIAMMFAAILVQSRSIVGQAGVAGLVEDRAGRPLPFVVVTSRTRNGFFSAYTDLGGRFDFRSRPHRSGDTIEFRSTGYLTHSIRLSGDIGEIAATLDSASLKEPSGWSIGLADGLHVQLLSVDGSVIDPLALAVDNIYRLLVASQGSARCSRSGPSAFDVSGTGATVAVADFVRNRDCGMNVTAHEQMFELIFDRVGLGAIRVVGRHRDIVVPISIGAGHTPGR